MNQPGDERPNQPTAERAAELGEQVGRLVSLALRRIETMARTGMSGQEPVGHVETPVEGAPADASRAFDRSPTKRAEELVDGAAERISQLTRLAGPSIRRFVALAREEAEDIWAEAQQIRRSDRRGSD